LKKHIILEIY